MLQCSVNDSHLGLEPEVPSCEFQVPNEVIRSLKHETHNFESTDRGFQCDLGFHRVGNQTIMLCLFNEFLRFGCITAGRQRD